MKEYPSCDPEGLVEALEAEQAARKRDEALFRAAESEFAREGNQRAVELRQAVNEKFAERGRADEWRDIAYQLYIWEHNLAEGHDDEPRNCLPNCYRCEAARKHDAKRRAEDDLVKP